MTASVIVCVKNRGRYVLDCLASLVAVNTPDVELVVVDDASTDDTPEIIATFKAQHPDHPIRVVTRERSCGLSAARNAGIDAASGDVMLFTDSDCVVDPEWVNALVDVFNEEGVWAAGGRVEQPAPRNIAERAYNGTSRVRASGRSVVGCNMAFLGTAAARVRFDETMTFFCEEDDIARRMKVLGGEIRFTPDAVVEHRHPMTLKTYLRRGYKHGRGSARYWYKHGVYVGRDILFMVLMLVTLPLAFINPILAWIPVGFFVLQLLALLYNELVYKQKPVVEALMVYPVSFAYSVLKCFGAIEGLARLVCRIDKPMVESTRRWKEQKRSGGAGAVMPART